MGVPYQAQVVDPNRFVTPAWRPFFDRLDKAIGGGSGDAPALLLGAGVGSGEAVDQAVDAALAELVSFRPAPTPLPTFASKSVVYADATGALAGNVSGLAWDHVNLRLGINRASPGYALEVRGTPVDIGYLISARPASSGSAFIQMQSNGASQAAGFAFTNPSTSVDEWRMFMLGSTSNALRFALNSTGLFWCSTAFNLILGVGPTVKDPASGAYVFVVQNGTAPGNLATDTAALYAADVTTSELFAKNEANEVTRITGDMQLPSGKLLRFGGTSATEVALKRATTTLEVRLADDSAYTNLRARQFLGETGVLATGLQTPLAPASFTTPRLHIGGDYDGANADSVGVAYIDGYGAQANITIRRTNGSAAVPTALADLDIIFNFRSVGYDGSASALGGLLRMIANGAWTGTNHGQDFLIALTDNGSTAAPTERLRVRGSGMLTFAGIAATSVGLKRSTTVLQTRLADDSAFAQHSALEFMNNRANFLMRTAVAWTNGAAAAVGTLTNAPTAGNPTKWIPVDDNGTTRYVPAW